MEFPKDWEGRQIILHKSNDYYEAPLYVVCCDCGLTHKYSYRGQFIKADEIKLYIKSERDEEKTKYVREARGIHITSKHPPTVLLKRRRTWRNWLPW